MNGMRAAHPRCTSATRHFHSEPALQNGVVRQRAAYKRVGPNVRVRASRGEGVTEADEGYMRRALDLAARAKGKTHPNPAVGCVLVKDGVVVGEGYHPKAGEPHAEVFALRAAGQKAAGATAYVTLEPCNHYGRTPPCSLALVEAQVARVVVGVVDPNPQVGGKGIERLRRKDITVHVSCLVEDCYAMNEEFMERMKQGV